ncbi:hypothetical protein [Altericroceibacterium xinjiangense]|uniref:hypothetical protein n=1 Tax=Altericroceibacterium xinjiangense TaxID=762261 RepID=UPI000F7EF0FA|nr:hypothetical protein [Altericroceibacterium xinjiangense]
MRFGRVLLGLAGALLILFGGIWALQGLGLLMRPTESFMLADQQWAVNGAIAVLIGLSLIWVARPRR